MDKKIKTEALLAMAEAYFLRGEWLQYDQLSMDRVVRISPRRESPGGFILTALPSCGLFTMRLSGICLKRI